MRSIIFGDNGVVKIFLKIILTQFYYHYTVFKFGYFYPNDLIHYKQFKMRDFYIYLTHTCPKLTQHELFAGANGSVCFSWLNGALEAEHMFVLWLSSLALTIPLLFLFVWALHVGSGTRMPNSRVNQLCHWGHLHSAAVGRHPKICCPNKRLQPSVESYQLKQSASVLNDQIIGAVTVFH